MSINKDSQKAPSLRFKGFTDDWEQRKLKSIGKTFTGLSGKTKEDFGHGEAEYIPYTNIFNNPITDVDQLESIEIDNKQNSVVYGDILFTTSSETPEEVGMSSVWMYEKENVYLNSFCFGFRPIEKHHPLYLAYLLRSPNMRKKFTLLAQGISRYNISKNKVLELTIPLPAISEQIKIGNTLKYLDNTITLHQRKLDQLNQLKESLLQQMFPGKGETVPKLRFAGFEGEWEERKLSALFIKGGSGGTPKSTNKDFYEGDIPFLGISDITKSNGFINNTEKHISVDGLNNSAAWVVPRGAISLAMYASVGKVAVLNINAATSQAFYNMVFDDDDLRDFVYQCLIKANELSEWNKLISTGTQANLNADKVKNFMLYLPQNHAEIKLISAFLKQFDTTIAIQQRKLDQLKNMKQVLLQNMFI
ncbi:restriction endonuclease subunit S [Aerococcus urinaeequi]|uniref:restriction endonuclease subunit S n=1 Tax=Aerococcus urinaeequi TaxID=51665 RepID=UPI003D6BCBDC